jgi:hypothetical protein
MRDSPPAQHLIPTDRRISEPEAKGCLEVTQNFSANSWLEISGIDDVPIQPRYLALHCIVLSNLFLAFGQPLGGP